ncbi:hypothetical protein AAG570_000865 [Ranatra chinensis]|uniref:Uncharacterized protein n=1 Tax=Ranatra chinensis TaxID=642074 RepID=A0ABD0Z8R3_9HEMI
MVEFSITFLVAFPFVAAEIERCRTKYERSKNSKSGKQKTPSNESKVPESGQERRSSSIVEEINNDPNFMRSCPAVKQACSIKYQLTESKSSMYSITIVYWGQIAKVYTKERVQPVKCLVRGSLAWVIFSIGHKLNIDNIKSLLKVHHDGIAFNFGEEKKHLHPKARSDGPRTYYKFGGDSDTGEWSCRLVEAVPGTIPPPPLPEEEEFESEVPKGSEIISSVRRQPDVSHRDAIIESLLRTEVYLAGRPEFDAAVEPKEEEEKSKETQINRTESINEDRPKPTGKKEKQVKKQIKITGDQLFFEWPHWSAGCFDPTERVPYIGLCLSVKRLMNEEQREIINTFGVYIKSVTGLPEKPVDAFSVNCLGVECCLGGAFPPFEVDPVPLVRPSSTVEIARVKTIFFANSDDRRVIESLQKECLHFKIYGFGRRNATENGGGCLFGTEPGDDGISNRVHNRPAPENVPTPTGKEAKKKKTQKKGPTVTKDDKLLIGFVSVDCSSFMRGEYRLDSSYHLTTQDTLDGHAKELKEWDTVMAINYEKKGKEEGIIQQSDFLTNDTQMQVVVQLSWASRVSCLANSLNQHGNYSCAILMITDREFAARLLRRLYKWNAAIPQNVCALQRMGFRLKNSRTEKEAARDLSNLPVDVRERLVTGFMVDCIEVTVMAIEGLATFSMPFLFSNIIQMHPKQGRMLYNSDILFTQRLYPELLTVSCVYAITLSQTLSSLVRHRRAYSDGSLPRPAWKALRSLDLLVRCATLRSALQQNLLPSAKDLLSLDVEFGVHVQLY